MKYGIYYAYWEKEWGGQFVPYVEKCRRLGFDILEVACGAFHLEEDGFFRELRALTASAGPCTPTGPWTSQSPWTSPAIGSAASGGWAAWRIWPLTAGLRCAWRPSTALRDT